MASVGAGHATVMAPISGMIAQRLIEQGETAAPGRPLLDDLRSERLACHGQHPAVPIAADSQCKARAGRVSRIRAWADRKFVTLLPTADAATHVSQVLPDFRMIWQMWCLACLRGFHCAGSAVRMTVPATAVVRRGEVAAVYKERSRCAGFASAAPR